MLSVVAVVGVLGLGLTTLVLWRRRPVGHELREHVDRLQSFDPADRARAGERLVSFGLGRAATPLLDHMPCEEDDRVRITIALAVVRRPVERKSARRGDQLREWAAEELALHGYDVSQFAPAVARRTGKGGAPLPLPAATLPEPNPEPPEDWWVEPEAPITGLENLEPEPVAASAVIPAQPAAVIDAPPPDHAAPAPDHAASLPVDSASVRWTADPVPESPLPAPPAGPPPPIAPPPAAPIPAEPLLVEAARLAPQPVEPAPVEAAPSAPSLDAEPSVIHWRAPAEPGGNGAAPSSPPPPAPVLEPPPPPVVEPPPPAPVLEPPPPPPATVAPIDPAPLPEPHDPGMPVIDWQPDAPEPLEPAASVEHADEWSQPTPDWSGPEPASAPDAPATPEWAAPAAAWPNGSHPETGPSLDPALPAEPGWAPPTWTAPSWAQPADDGHEDEKPEPAVPTLAARLQAARNTR